MIKFRKIILLIWSLFFVQFLLAGISAEQKELNEKVKNFYGLQSLPANHQKGFIYQQAVKEMYGTLSSSLQKTYNKMILAPERQFTYQSPSGIFNLHYDITGDHAVPLQDVSGNGVPDFVDSAGVYMDYSWQLEVNQLGYKPPLDINGEPVTSYDVYFTNFIVSEGIYGGYGFTTFLLDIPSLPGSNYTSYIEMNHTFQEIDLYTNGLPGLKVTCAHELHHAIQLSYRLRSEDIYFFEMTSTFMEEIAYDDINDYYQYLPGIYLNYSNNNLTSRILRDDQFRTIQSEYGNGIFLHMIAQQWGVNTIREIWEEIIDEKALDAVNSILHQKGSSFGNALNDYGKWMYFSGDLAMLGFFYEEASAFPNIGINPEFIFKAGDNYFKTMELKPHTFNYFKAKNVQTISSIVKARPQNNESEIRVNFFNENILDKQPVDGSIQNQLIIDQKGQDIVIAVSNSSDQLALVDFSFLADTTILPDSSDHNKIAFGPNPVVVSKGRPHYFYSVPAQTKIIIVDLNQRPVRTLFNTLNVEAQIQWDLKDSNGQMVHSGIYFYVNRTSGSTKIGKIAVVH